MGADRMVDGAERERYCLECMGDVGELVPLCCLDSTDGVWA
jgi:hypothetical protein